MLGGKSGFDLARNVSMLVFQTGRPARIDDYAHASGPGADPSRACGVQLRAARAAIIPGRISHARLLSGASHQKSASRRSAAWERGGPVARAAL